MSDTVQLALKAYIEQSFEECRSAFCRSSLLTPAAVIEPYLIPGRVLGVCLEVEGREEEEAHLVA